MSQYLVKKVYDTLVGDQVRISWDKVVWNKLSLPKHIFIIWLAIQEKVAINSKTNSGISSSDSCLLCAQHKEDHHRLFFRCPFILACLLQLKNWMSCSSRFEDLHHLIRWTHNSTITKYQKQVFLIGVVTLIYLIWHSRN